MPLKKGKKPTTTSDLRTLIAIVLDESGSMDTRREETISSVNFYLNSILDAADTTAIVTLAEFSDMGSTEDHVRFVERNTPITEVYELTEETYRPRGNTPLYDAVGLTIRAVEKENVDRFLFVIVTDGWENTSREFTREKIVDIITEKEKTDRWTFVYLAAGQDAWAGASSIGISTPGTTRSYTGAKGTTAQQTQVMAASTVDYLASSKTVAPDFWSATEEEETKTTPKKVTVSS